VHNSAAKSTAAGIVVGREEQNAGDTGATAHRRFQALVSGAVLALIVGWVLYIGRDVFVPIVFAILAVYVIVGLTRLLGRIPVVGRALSLRTRYVLSILVIAACFVEAVYLIIAYKDSVLALAPQYQQSLLAVIQQAAVFLRVEAEPTWATLRQDLFAQVNVQSLIGSTVASVSAIVVGVIVVLLYASFLLLERASFANKIAHLSSDPAAVGRIGDMIEDVNARIGSYLALKTFICLLLGVVSWVAMAIVGLQFAGFWAVLIGLLNYVPYFGSFLGVLFPTAMAVVQFASPNEVMVVLVALIVAQFVIGNFLEPYVMGSSLNLSPFAILVSLTVWSGLWGVAGAFLAVPITAIMAIVFSRFPGTRPIAVLLSRNGEL
jgi:predicted PurR-regulated permease PerM